MKTHCSECAHGVANGTLGSCPVCGGILSPNYDDQAVGKLASIEPGHGIDRYRSLMPATSPIPFLGEGGTPLLTPHRLGRDLGLTQLFFKVEGLNPSGTFKDRPAALAAALAHDEGKRGVITAAASGNAATAIATYAAAADLKCVILTAPESSPENLRHALAVGARLVTVEGIFRQTPEAIIELITTVADETDSYLAFVWAPINPYLVEGIKSLSYEIAARLSGPPDVVVSPVGGGDMLAAQWRGYLELQRAGVIDRLPRMIGVQSESAAPLLTAFREELVHVPSLSQADSKLPGINVRFTGNHALRAIRDSGGSMAGVTDEDAFLTQRRLGIEEGLWIAPESAVTVAALADLLERGEIEENDRLVCILSGAGYKEAHLYEGSSATVSRAKPLPFDARAILDGVNH